MHEPIDYIINALWCIVVLGLVVLFYLHLRDFYKSILFTLNESYIKHEYYIKRYVYKCSLSKHYNHFLFILTIMLTLILREIGLIFVYIYNDLINTSDKQIKIFLYVLEENVDKVVYLLFFAILLLLSLRIMSIFLWKILKILYFPEQFRNY